HRQRPDALDAGGACGTGPGRQRRGPLPAGGRLRQPRELAAATRTPRGARLRRDRGAGRHARQAARRPLPGRSPERGAEPADGRGDRALRPRALMAKQIPSVTVSRLVAYLRVLTALEENGVDYVTSEELGAAARVSAHQVRKDLVHVRENQRQGRNGGASDR